MIVVLLHHAGRDQPVHRREDLHGLVRQHVPGKIEIVDGHASQQPSRRAEELHGRRLRVAGRDDDLPQIADPSGQQRIADGGVARIESAVEADLHRNIRTRYRGPASADSPDVQIDRLFAEHRLFRGDGLLDVIGMRGG